MCDSANVLDVTNTDFFGLEPELREMLTASGKEGHRIAQAHHNDPWSSSFTFGTDRYQRAITSALGYLPDFGFTCTRKGAGLQARRGELELNFATARGDDPTKIDDFDTHTSTARRRAAAINADVLKCDGMPGADAQTVAHVVWGGTLEDGLVSMHVGRLVDRGGNSIDWEDLQQVYPGGAAPERGRQPVPAAPGYDEQPEPGLVLQPRTPATARDEEHGS
jgi:hypothetical protein